MPACQSASSSGGPCTAPLDQVRTYCPDSYPDLGALVGPCGDPRATWAKVSAGVCGGHPAVAYDWGTHWELCTYASADAGSLVGALLEEDDNAFCGSSAYLLGAGQVDMSCDPRAMTLVGTCSPLDGGADAAVGDASGG
jgi:hypothetical protein